MEPALSQLEKLTAAETHRLDRAIVAISVNPELGTPVPDTPPKPEQQMQQRPGP
ncbi:hypothetical protein ACIP3A_39335 [Streptomyces tricolor]|uniref:hypothetical protein n=1 Tax=Streptomyces tricolor TaxID=68277 RepID=UPI00380A173D